MPIPTTGSVSFSQLRSEIKNTSTGSVSFSELYYGSSFLPSNRAVLSPMKDLPIDTLQTRSVSQYRGVYRYYARTISINSVTNDFRLRNNLSGWNTILPVMVDVTLTSSAIIYASFYVDVRLSSITGYNIGTIVYRYRTYGCYNGGYFLVGTVTERNTTNNTIRIQYGTQITGGGAGNRVQLALGQTITTTAGGSNPRVIEAIVPSPAFEVKDIPTTSSVFVENNGAIYGRGGVGGRGARIDDNAESGEPGGPSIRVMCNTSNVNTDSQITFTLLSNNASIYGGGGGGGGGAYAYGNDPRYGGGGGGGGAGFNSGLGNEGGEACNGLSRNGFAGSNGTLTTGGAGGAGGLSQGPQTGNNAGGSGGNLNTAGSTGVSGTTSPGTGGAAGYAIEGPVIFTNQTISNIIYSAVIRV